ncbi:MAG: PTS sugar transporter subunit IIA [Holosporales bacterium]
MTLTDILCQNRVRLGMSVADKTAALALLAELAAGETSYQAAVVRDALKERERLGSTGIGRGVALPHIRLIGLDRMVGFFVQLTQPVDFHSIDGRPVDLMFLLLSPCQTTRDNAAAQHVQALASITRLLRENGTCDQLRTATETATICRILRLAPALAAAEVA